MKEGTFMRKWLMLVVGVMLTGAVCFGRGAANSATEQEHQLVGVLKSSTPEKEKADACRELARVGTKEAVAPLAALLGDEHLSHMARYALETIPDPAVDGALRKALGKLHGQPLVGVIGSIGVRRDRKAVKPLSRLLHDSDPEVAQAAARALGSIGNPSAAKALMAAQPHAASGNIIAFDEGLFRCAERLAASGRTQAAVDIYDHVRWEFNLMSSPMDASEEPRFSPQLLTAAWSGAILCRKEAGVPLLVEALHSPNRALFLAALRISQEMPGVEVTLVLAGELDKQTADRQIPLVQTLARRRDAEALPALFAHARRSEKPVRLEAIKALAQVGQPAVVPVLVELLGESDAEISRTAQESLAAVPGKEADAAALGLLTAKEPERRVSGIELIARRRMTSALPELFKAAADPEAKVGAAAIKKIGELGGLEQTPALLDLLASARTPEQSEAAEQALSAVNGRGADAKEAANRLGARLADAPPAQKCALLRVLAAVGGTDALKLVRGAVDNPDADVHATALRALGNWNSAEAAPELLALARTAEQPGDKSLCLRGYLHLADQTDIATEKRLEMCRQAADLVQTDDEKKLLLAALGGIHSAEAVELVKPYLGEEGIKKEAETAVVSVAEKLLDGKDGAKQASKLVEPLEQVSRDTGNEDLAKRAKALVEKAKKKAGV